MPYNRYKCDPAVKFLCRNHGKCARERHGVFTATGTQLVKYAVSKGGLQLPSTCVLPEGFSLDGEYSVCKNMHRMLSGMDKDGDEPMYILKSTGGKYSMYFPFFFSRMVGGVFSLFFLSFGRFSNRKRRYVTPFSEKKLLDTFFVIFSRRFLFCH